MKTRETLALLIPAYNAGQFLPRLLESAHRQAEPFDQIWVYDDCSTDNTAAVAEYFGARVIRGDTNRGCSHGKNRLAAETDCDWIHFHDADDELMPNFVERARHWISDGRFDVVLFGFEERNNYNEERMAVHHFDAAAIMTDSRAYTIRNQLNSISGLYRHTAILNVGGYDEHPLVLYNEDVAFHIRLAFHGLSFTADKTVTVINHRQDSSMSGANRLKCLQAQYHVLRRTAALNGSERYASDIAHRLWDVIGCLAAHLDWLTADDAVRLAVRLGGRFSAPTTVLFRVLSALSPHVAIRTRESIIRAVKPALRRGYPRRELTRTNQ